VINVGHLLFLSNQNTLYFNPVEFVACGFVHEEAHRNFFQASNMIGRGKETDEFHKSHYFELEEDAILQELGFLENVKKVVPATMGSRSFVVKSWTDLGFPDCTVNEITVCPPIRLDFLISDRKNVLNQMKSLQSQAVSKDDCQK